MASISLKAISNNKKLLGTEISYREAIASYCATYVPYTDKQVKVIGERVGMDPAQSSNALHGLIDKGEVARENGRIYLLVLDPYQLEKISQRDFKLIETLARLGCDDAKNLIVKITKEIEDSTIETKFLLHFFMFSQLSEPHLNLLKSQSSIVENTILNVKTTIALKEYNVLRNVLRNVLQNKDKEESLLSLFSISEAENKIPETDDNTDSVSGISSSEPSKSDVPLERGEGSPNDSPRKTDVPTNGEGSKPLKHKTDVPLERGEGRGSKIDEADIKQKLRKDIKDHLEWLAWLKKHPDYEQVDVQEKNDELIAWCAKPNRGQPNRRRLIIWLNDERDSVPINFAQNKEEKTNGNGLSQENSNGNNSRNGKSNYEISKSRDYSDFEGVDPIEFFAE